jgi:hypothetical protein
LHPYTGGLKYSGPWDHWSQKFFYAGRKKKGKEENEGMKEKKGKKEQKGKKEKKEKKEKKAKKEK